MLGSVTRALISLAFPSAFEKVANVFSHVRFSRGNASMDSMARKQEEVISFSMVSISSLEMLGENEGIIVVVVVVASSSRRANDRFPEVRVRCFNRGEDPIGFEEKK